jgi:hypothetical protein
MFKLAKTRFIILVAIGNVARIEFESFLLRMASNK